MRTTLVLADHLLVEAKKLAAERRTSLTRIMEESLRGYLALARARPPKADIRPLPVVRGGRLVKGVDLTDTSELLEIE